ncbi:MAG: TRAP transporter small permease [Pseudomonadota bacterium]
MVVKTLGAIAIAANVVGTLVVIGLVAVLNYDVVARGAFSAPFLGAVEIVQFSMVLIVFLQLPDVVRTGRLTRSDGFLLVVGSGHPRMENVMRRIADLISAVLMALITVATWPEFLDAWESGDYFGVPGVFTAPWWPVKGTIVFSAALCTLLFAAKVIQGPTAGISDVPRDESL